MKAKTLTNQTPITTQGGGKEIEKKGQKCKCKDFTRKKPFNFLTEDLW